MNFFIVFCFSLALLLACFFVAYFGKNWNLKPVTALSSGLLLALCFLDFLPHSFESSHSRSAISFFIFIGILAQGLADIYLLPRLSFLDRLLKAEISPLSHDHSHTLSAGSVCSVTGCLSICSFFDGIRLFSALSLEAFAGAMTALALFFHLLSEGVLLAGLALSSGIKKRVLLILSLSVAGALTLGGLLAQIFSISFSAGFLMAFSTGILIYICFVHLLPFSLKPKNKLWFFAGLILFSASHFLFLK